MLQFWRITLKYFLPHINKFTTARGSNQRLSCYKTVVTTCFAVISRISWGTITAITSLKINTGSTILAWTVRTLVYVCKWKKELPLSIFFLQEFFWKRLHCTYNCLHLKVTKSGPHCCTYVIFHSVSFLLQLSSATYRIWGHADARQLYQHLI